MDFKSRIKARRIELGLTTDEVAKIVGVSNGTISRWETGAISNQRRDKIELLAKALKTTPAELLGYSDTVSSPQSETPASDEELELLHKDPRYRTLLSAAAGLKESDINFVIDLINRMKNSGE